MVRTFLLILVALTLASSVSAQDRVGYGNGGQTLYGVCDGNCGYGPAPLMTGPPPPPCTNKFDFSVACNSQYAAIGGIL